mmetsp:Transcript_3954/g.4494  ORF Transcript_3954/g.4494 Transcript_3954/m.4494 type:complete len:83 (+) Transcript_3954:405-653(+)
MSLSSLLLNIQSFSNTRVIFIEDEATNTISTITSSDNKHDIKVIISTICLSILRVHQRQTLFFAIQDYFVVTSYNIMTIIIM